MVTSKDYPEETINTFINLFKYAQQFYGQRISDEFSFSMFFSELPYSDLIFQDATQKLIVLPGEHRHHKSYLGREFSKAFEEVECSYVAGCGQLTGTFSLVLLICGIKYLLWVF